MNTGINIRNGKTGVSAGILAAGLLWADRWILLAMYPFIIAPALIEDVVNRFDPAIAFGLSTADRAVELIFLAVISMRWAGRLGTGPGKLRISDFIQLLTFGFLLWVMIVFPPALAGALGETLSLEVQTLLFAALFLPGVFLSYRYFMYFFPIIFGSGPLRSKLAAAASFLEGEKYLPLKVLAAPAGITGLLMALFSAPYPDGRSFVLSVFGDVSSGLLWLTGCYLGLAYGLILTGDKAWREMNLDPYREARLTTIALGAPSWLGPLLSLKAGSRMLIVAMFVWIGNYTRLELMPPAASIVVTGAEASGDLAQVNIEVVDERYGLRAFRPVHFRLAGENYLDGKSASSLIAPVPFKVESTEITADMSDLRFYIPVRTVPVRLTLMFRTARSGEALTALQDLFLWYRHAKIAPVKFDRADSGISAPREAAPQGSS